MGIRTMKQCLYFLFQEIKITLGDGSFLGRIVQKYNFCSPLLIVEDDAGNRVAEITGPTCTDCCCSCCCTGACGCDVKFQIKTSDGQEIGIITKKWSGFVQEQLTDSDTFGVNFPKDMEVRAKAMMLGAVFLIVSFYNYLLFYDKIQLILVFFYLGFYVL